MPETSERAFEVAQRRSLPRRLTHYLGRRLMRRVFLPGDSLADALKRAAVFVVGWGTFIGLLAWGGYRQGFLHGIGEGITFCVILFVLAVLKAPDFMRPGGSQGRDQY